MQLFMGLFWILSIAVVTLPGPLREAEWYFVEQFCGEAHLSSSFAHEGWQSLGLDINRNVKLQNVMGPEGFCHGVLQAFKLRPFESTQWHGM